MPGNKVGMGKILACSSVTSRDFLRGGFGSAADILPVTVLRSASWRPSQNGEYGAMSGVAAKLFPHNQLQTRPGFVDRANLNIHQT